MYIAIDIGGTNTRIIAFEDVSLETEKDSIRFDTEKLFENEYKKVIDFIHEVRKREKIQAISISQTGTVNRERNILLSSEFCPDFAGKPFATFLQKEFDCEAYMENDALCAGFAELIFGAQKNTTRLAYITISTGVGGVFIKRFQDKYEVLRTGLGHFMLVGEGKVCTCGKIDCIEAYVGGHSLSQRFLKEAKDINDLRVWETAVEYLALASVNLIRMCSPDALVFGGGMIENNEYIREKLQYEIKSQLRHADMPIISISAFGDKIGAYGALALIPIHPSSII